MGQDETLRLMEEHVDAWNSHDLDRLMSLFTPDCVFEASGGALATGDHYAGIDAVRSAFAAVLEAMPDAHWAPMHHHAISDTYGVSEWTLTGTYADGGVVEVNGCDFLTVDRGRIAKKNSFRKQRPVSIAVD